MTRVAREAGASRIALGSASRGSRASTPDLARAIARSSSRAPFPVRRDTRASQASRMVVVQPADEQPCGTLDQCRRGGVVDYLTSIFWNAIEIDSVGRSAAPPLAITAAS